MSWSFSNWPLKVRGETGRFVSVLDAAAQVIGDGGVVGCGVFEGAGGQVEAGVLAQGTVVLGHFVEYALVIVGIHDHGHVIVVLGGSPGACRGRRCRCSQWRWRDHTPGRLRLPRRVEVDHHHVDGRDAVFGHHVVVRATAPENAAVDRRVQGLDAARHDFREAGVLRDFGNLDVVAIEKAEGAAGGRISTPCCCRAWANSTMPLLSETLMGARRIGGCGSWCDMVLLFGFQ